MESYEEAKYQRRIKREAAEKLVLKDLRREYIRALIDFYGPTARVIDVIRKLMGVGNANN